MQTDKLGIKNKVTIGAKIVDLRGQLFRVVDVKKIKNVYPFWRFEFFNPMVFAELQVSATGEKYEVEELKSLIHASIKKDPHIWEASGEIESIRTAVTQANSIEGLMSKLKTHI